MIGVGIDVVEIERFRKIITDRFAVIERLFTKREIEYCQKHADPAPSFAVRFAAKEAVMKAMGVGIGAFEFKDVEVLRSKSGLPSIALYGKALVLSEAIKVTSWKISLSHEVTIATAIAIAE